MERRLNAGGIRRHEGKGFTLMELMIAVAVIGILTAIAFPSYQQYIRKAHRSEAQAFLMDVAQRQQQYFLDNRVYGTLENLGMAPTTDLASRYNFTATPQEGPPPTYTLTATAKGAQVGSGEPAELKLESNGNKSPAGYW